MIFMKFYSEVLKEMFDTAEACATAEAEHAKAKAEKEALAKAKAEERKARAKEVEEAYNAKVAAEKQFKEKLSAFCKDFGPYHMTIKNPEENEKTISALGFSPIFDGFFGF